MFRVAIQEPFPDLVIDKVKIFWGIQSVKLPEQLKKALLGPKNNQNWKDSITFKNETCIFI